jgi:hypothetical protein
MAGWIGVDLDGTLAHYDGIWRGDEYIGEPVGRALSRPLAGGSHEPFRSNFAP